MLATTALQMAALSIVHSNADEATLERKTGRDVRPRKLTKAEKKLAKRLRHAET